MQYLSNILTSPNMYSAAITLLLLIALKALIGHPGWHAKTESALYNQRNGRKGVKNTPEHASYLQEYGASIVK